MESRKWRGADVRYALVEQAMRTYADSQRKQVAFPIPRPEQPAFDATWIESDLMWLLLSRARGVAALIRGLPRPTFGDAPPAAFPSWIDRGAQGVDPARPFYPPSRHVCAAETVERLLRTVVAETAPAYWDIPAVQKWLESSTADLLREISDLDRRRQHREGAGILDEGEHVREIMQRLAFNPPPVPDPDHALQVLRRELLHVVGYADAQDPDVDEDFRYWVNTRPLGTHLRVLVTVGRRVVGRAVVKLKNAVSECTAQIRLAYEDNEDRSMILLFGDEPYVLPWRVKTGADEKLAKRIALLPAPGRRA